jgi:hypothetical protein
VKYDNIFCGVSISGTKENMHVFNNKIKTTTLNQKPGQFKMHYITLFSFNNTTSKMKSNLR